MIKSTIILAALIALALGGAQFTDVSTFSTADELLTDIHKDKENIYGIVFFKRDDTDRELTESNSKLLKKLADTAAALADQIEDEETKKLFFARVDITVEKNKKLWKKFGLKENACDEYPAGVVLKDATGYKFAGPAIVSIFEEKMEEVAGLATEEAAVSYTHLTLPTKA